MYLPTGESGIDGLRVGGIEAKDGLDVIDIVESVVACSSRCSVVA